VRIIAGKWRGRVLKAPPGATTRPTGDRTREALFSMLVSRLGSFESLSVADVFAGSGALGLEALSRGAAFCTFIDQDRDAVKAIKANIDLLGADGEVLPIAVAGIGPARRRYDLLMFDPPYGSGGAGALIEKMTRLGWAADSAWATIETRSDESVSAEGWAIDVERTYGIAKLSVLCRTAPAQPG
jgi:16S rRNA (guanine966-N2)-methyltransferase